MGRGNFTKTEMETLLRNPYVADVNEKSISYSTEFKFLFMDEYIKGKRPTQIFREVRYRDPWLEADRTGMCPLERILPERHAGRTQCCPGKGQLILGGKCLSIGENEVR